METPRTLRPSEGDPSGGSHFRMIDIARKRETHRRAIASGRIVARADTISRIKDRSLPKGDVLVLAEIAGIQGAKQASLLLPLCHPLSLTYVRVWTEVSENSVRVFCEAKSVGKTGVEMEALCGVNSALLCIYDLTKGIDPVLRIEDIALEIKEGGKSGLWLNPESVRAKDLIRTDKTRLGSLDGVTAEVITLSDRCSRGEREDESGPVAVHWLTERGARVTGASVLPDEHDRFFELLDHLLARPSPPSLIIASGGTGLSPRDIAPETVMSFCNKRGGREVPGLGECLRQEGARFTERAWLSRSIAVVVARTMVLSLPGSPNAVREGLDAIGGLLGHLSHIVEGGSHDSV